VLVRQRFLLQKACPDDDRHVLALRLDDGRVTATPSHVGPAGTMAVEHTDDRLMFTLGVEPCHLHVVLGKGDLATDTPPTADARLGKPLDRHAGPRTVAHDIRPKSPVGCARGSATIRAYWGSVDHSSSMVVPDIRARFDSAGAPRSNRLLTRLAFGSGSCRIGLQIWKAG
jgi:hypothetical protein